MGGEQRPMAEPIEVKGERRRRKNAGRGDGEKEGLKGGFATNYWDAVLLTL